MKWFFSFQSLFNYQGILLTFEPDLNPMFFIFSKLLTFLLQPLTWLFLLLLFATFSRSQVRKRKALIFMLALFYFFCNSFISNEFMHVWEVPALAEDNIPVYDAGIVLSNVMSYDIKLHKYQYTSSSDRLLQAIQLYKKGKIKKIVFTGGSGSMIYRYAKEGMHVRNILLRAGVPPSDMFIESESNNTHENALFTRPILEKNVPKGKYLLITSAYHMRRALACFEKVGVHVDPYSTDRMSGDRKFIFDYMFIPNTDALETWQIGIHEIIGFIIYKIAGYA